MNSDLKDITQNDLNLLHETFILFGDPDAPYWFLGLEEGDHPGDGVVIDNFVRHLLVKTKKYNDAGKLSLRNFSPEDGHKFLPKLEDSGVRSGKNVKYQATWGGYIKLLLSAEMHGSGTSWTIEDVKQYQKYNLGELGNSEGLPKSCLMELFPMARKGRKKGQWPYSLLADREGMEFMKTPSSYKDYAEQDRAKLLLSLVKKHQPKYLVCFGGDCKRVLMSQIDEEPNLLKIHQGKREMKVSTVSYGGTKVIFSNHPTSHGISNLYWKNLGAQLASL